MSEFNESILSSKALKAFFCSVLENDQYIKQFFQFQEAYMMGRQAALSEASEYVRGWKNGLEPMYNSILIGTINEIAGGVGDL